MIQANKEQRALQTIAPAYQPGCPIIDLLEGGGQRDLLDSESDPCKAELASDVHAADLHVHGHDLHGAHTPADRQRLSTSFYESQEAEHTTYAQLWLRGTQLRLGLGDICVAREDLNRGTMRRSSSLRGQEVLGGMGPLESQQGQPPHRQRRGSPLLNGMQELLEGPEGCALSPDAQAAHVYHVSGLRGT